MEILILASVLVLAMATVDLPNCRSPRLEMIPVKARKVRRRRTTDY